MQWCCKREVTWCFKKSAIAVTSTWRPHILLAPLSLLSHPFLLFRMERVFAWVVAVPAKCTSESGCCVLNWKHEHMSVRGKMASLRRVTSLWLSSLISQQRCIAGKSTAERHRNGFSCFFASIWKESHASKLLAPAGFTALLLWELEPPENHSHLVFPHCSLY